MARYEEGLVVGIDLGTTYSCVGVWDNDGEDIIVNDQGNRTTPSYVSFNTTECSVGKAANNQVHRNSLSLGVKTTGQNLPSRSVHASHRSDHELQLKNYNTLCECNGCKRPAFGRIYRCELCNFNLHIHCMFPKPTAQHDFFENSTFEFLDKLPGTCRCKDCHRCCEVCAKRVEGSVYYCEQNGCNLHPCCFNIPSKLQIYDVEFELTDKELYGKCLWCEKKRPEGSVTGNSGWSCVSKCKNYRCHAFCSTKMLLEEWKKADPNDKSCLVPKNLKVPVKSQLKRNETKRKEGQQIC